MNGEMKKNKAVSSHQYSRVLALYVLCVLGLAACGGGSSAAPEPTSNDPVVDEPATGGGDDTPTDPVTDPEPVVDDIPDVDPAPITLNGFPGSILLGKPTDTSMTVSIVTAANATVSIDYGESSDIDSGSTADIDTLAGMPVEIVLTGLKANTQYFYQVNSVSDSGASQTSQQASFYTQRASSAAFNFAIHADAHVGIRLRGPDEEEKADDAQYTKTFYNTLAYSPDFLIDLGDTFMSEKNAQRDFYDMTDTLDPTPPTQAWVEEDYIFLRSFFNLSGHSVPLYLVNGNHEGESGWEKHEEESIAVWATNLRKGLFPAVTANEFYRATETEEPFVGTHDGYYEWTWGAAQFVVLDPFWYADTKPKVDNEWAWTLGKEQYDWLSEVLATSDASYTFVFLHNLVGGLNGSDGVGSGRGGALVAKDWEWGGHNAYSGVYEFDSQRPGWAKPVHDLLVEHGVDVVFHGHDHVFAREDHPDGIIYQAVPQPSILRDNDNRALSRAEAAAYDVVNGVIRGGSGFLNVEVSPQRATVSFIRTDEDISEDDCLTQGGCYETVYSYVVPNMTLTSPALKDTGSTIATMPLSYTCEGANGGTSPWLTWTGVPDQASALAVLMRPRDDANPSGVFSVFNIPAATNSLLPGDFSAGIAAQGDMTAAELAAAEGLAYTPPCVDSAGESYEYDITLYALSAPLNLTASATHEDVESALQASVLSKTSLPLQRVHWGQAAIAADAHVPSTVASTCDEKTEHFMSYSRVHQSVDCDEGRNQMDVVSHISDGLKTGLNDQQVQVGISRWIGRLSFPSQAGAEIRIAPSYRDSVSDNISCDGTGKLGVSVDGQIILPYFKQSNDANGDNCGPNDGNDYANRDTVVLGEVDQCYGHSPNGEGYHLHGAPICLMDVHDPSKPVAYMSDGIPLYFGQAGGTIENTAHAQTAPTVTTTNFGAGLYEHLDFRPSDVKDGSNPLNACNAYDINGDGAESGYVYYTTKDAPYAIGCFMGDVLADPTQVQVDRTNFSQSRAGWDGQTVGQGIDATIVGNYLGEFNGHTYNMTELLVTGQTSFLDEGDYAQVLWRVLQADDAGYQADTSCFELRYRADKTDTSNDEVEISCSRNPVPQSTLDFTPFDTNQDTAFSSSVDVGPLRTFTIEAWADNWFAAYLGDRLIVEDSVPITEERSFNAETAEFEARYPLQLNVIVKDFIENDTGLEYIGEDNQQIGDGGFIAQIRDTSSGQIVAASDADWRCLVIHEAPLDSTCATQADPQVGVAPCEARIVSEPSTWKSAAFDDTAWAPATVYSELAVAPKEGYDDIDWDSQAQLIWGADLLTHNTLLCRVTVEQP